MAASGRAMWHCNCYGLLDAGNTVILVEHGMRVAAAGDRVIDTGPCAGGEGGKVIAAGAPEKVARSRRGKTARFLAEALAD